MCVACGRHVPAADSASAKGLDLELSHSMPSPVDSILLVLEQALCLSLAAVQEVGEWITTGSCFLHGHEQCAVGVTLL